MTRLPRTLPVLAVAGLALVTRTILAVAIPFPTPEDTAYYVMVARNLVEGRGMVSDALWSYGTLPLAVPGPAFELWLPLPSLLAVPLMSLLGPGLRAAQVLPVVAGTVVAVATTLLARDLARERGADEGRARTVALGAGLTAAVALPLVLHGALPDSTMLFGSLALLACLQMTRLGAVGSGVRPTRTGLVGLGVLIGLAALTRNEAVWLGITWALMVVTLRERTLRERLRLVAIPAAIAGLVYLPWAARQAVTFGTPIPGQAARNALSVRPEDVFAWGDPPTLARLLDQGVGWLVASRLDGLRHDLVDVLLLPGLPASLLGFLALATIARRSLVLRPLLLFSVITFAVTSLVFPVATTWGTFLHAAVPVHALLIVVAAALVDDAFRSLARRRGWHRPTTWLGHGGLVAGAATVSLLLGTTVDHARGVAWTYDALARALPAVGVTLGPDAPPLVTDHPIWFAEALRSPAIALPDEDPASVLSLATRFGARYLLVVGEDLGRWPAVLASAGSDEAGCFDELSLAVSPPPGTPAPRLWRIDCP